MIVIGMLHHRKNPHTVKKAYAYAAVAKAEGAELIFFSPKMVDFNERIIQGYQYKEGSWVQVNSRFPDVIYNAGSPEKLKKSEMIINRLKKLIPFTTHSIGNKMSVYNRLQVDGTFSQYLIPSHIIFRLPQFTGYLNKYKKIVFKPVNGHKGQNVTYIEIRDDKYYVLNKEINTLLSEKELLDYVKAKLDEESYLVQPYIKSRTKNGNPYDFRLHTQKNGKGEWVITAIYPRIGPVNSIVSNINSGGATNYLEPFLKQEFPNEHFDIKQYLEQFSLKLSKKMDELQKKYFNESLDELGIDVGLDEKHKIWIFEVNWRPGCPPAFYLELDVVKNLINYAIFLAKHRKE